MDKSTLAVKLHEVGAIRFGQFLLNSGIISPVYIDLRVLIGYPSVLKMISEVYEEMLEELTFDRLVAVPYAAVPIVTAISLSMGRPFIYPRKETKDHGTGQKIEGPYSQGERGLIVDDLVTSAKNTLACAVALSSAGLITKDVVVLLDREQGGREALQNVGLTLHAFLTLREVLEILVDKVLITPEKYEEVVQALWE